MHWKEVFKRDFGTKIKESNKEFKLYKKTDKIIYLQQACNKIFSAVENFLMHKYSQRHRNYSAVREMVSSNQSDYDLLIDANQLHRFYYNAELQMDRYDAEAIYKRVYVDLKNKLRTRNR